MKNLLFLLLVFQFLISCSSKSILLTKISLNEDRESAFGLPIESTREFIVPCFNENRIFIDTLQKGIIVIEKIDTKYEFSYKSINDSIIGFFDEFPFESLDYFTGYDIESYKESELEVYRVKKLLRSGEWFFYSDGKLTKEKYTVKISRLQENIFCK